MELTLFGILVGSFVLALSGALMPGPLLTVTVVESVRRGFMTGPLLILGHGILELALIVALVKGAASYLKQGVVSNSISVVGGGVLFWMGLGMIMQSRPMSLLANSPAEKEVKSAHGFHPVAEGILVSASNPYWLLWWLTIGLGYLLMAMRYGIMGMVSFFVGHIMADLMWYSVVSYGVSRGRRLLTDKVYRGIIRFCGLFLILFGLWFLFAAMRYFFAD
jgi:threonine/homoserine/homoserine lactone efflux protein